MKNVTTKLMQKIDKKSTEKYGIPSLILMENAAIASAFCVLQMLKKNQRRVTILCGQGNNGGDGFACARHLINHGIKIKVYFSGKKEKLSDEAVVNYQILRKVGQRILKPKPSLLKKELKNTDLIVDALLGIGIAKRVREPIFTIIELLNASEKPILSLDVPSGINATSGKVCGIAIQAVRTVTFGLLKKGLLSLEARKYAGKVVVGDISLPRQLCT